MTYIEKDFAEMQNLFLYGLFLQVGGLCKNRRIICVYYDIDLYQS